jgi:hypothetical protein
MMVMEGLKNEAGPFITLVDTESALESVVRAVKKEKRTAEVSRSGHQATITIGPKPEKKPK